jgi:tetratricopeptide (TPR) repeat protein
MALVRSWLSLLWMLILLLVPRPAKAEGLVAQAEQLLSTVSQTRDRDRRFLIAEQAQALCERAIRERPNDAAPHIVLSRALTTADPQHPESCRPHACERATAELELARKLDANGLEAERIASELGLLLSRIGKNEAALIEYNRALRLIESERTTESFDDYGRAVLLANSAETLMALGKLDDSIARYRQAEAAANPGKIEWELAEWGLGVALDRDGQLEKAREAIQRALDYDPTMVHLSDENVFFEPTGDKRYYEALGHEIAGDSEEAIEAWHAFLVEAPGSTYARRARMHLADLKRIPLRNAGRSRAQLAVTEILNPRGLRPMVSLREIVRHHEDEVRLCYARALRSEPKAKGELRIRLLLHPSGFLLARAQVVTSTVVSETLPRCVELSASTWRFSVSDILEPEEVIVGFGFGED